MSESIALPPARICLGITGHRHGNSAFAANQPGIEQALTRIFDAIDRVTMRQKDAATKTRLHSLLAQGADMMAVEQACQRQWDIVAPLPFGSDLTIAINAEPESPEQLAAILQHQPCGDPDVEKRVRHVRDIACHFRIFELAEQDRQVEALLTARLADPANTKAEQDYLTIIGERVAAAGRVMVEQSDLLIAIWDGVTPGAIGGTRHTISVGVKLGTPVIWIDARAPERILLLRSTEELFALDTLPAMSERELELLLEHTLTPPASDQNERAIRFHTEQWHSRSHRRFHAYRRIEALFGGKSLRERFGRLVQTYESPAEFAAGSGAATILTASALPGGDAAFVERIKADIFERFAWADGLSTFLSDAYRGGMVTNFLLSALAIMVGVAYLPLASVDAKWPFALGEFILLVSILVITTIGRRRQWHGRWFETRRVAEYFRHAPNMLLLGVARSAGRWPRGADTEWPEYYAREVLCDIGLPSVKIGQAYLREALEKLLHHHASQQRVYHEGKAQRLTRVHHRLDRLSEWLFTLAVLSVSTYLVLILLASFGAVSDAVVDKTSKSFTFLGVILPALGGAFAGIRYFGDFERFAAISEVTAEKLAEVEERIAILLKVPDGELRYAQVAEIAHAMDDIVVSEIENWQSVFGGKQIAVPV